MMFGVNGAFHAALPPPISATSSSRRNVRKGPPRPALRVAREAIGIGFVNFDTVEAGEAQHGFESGLGKTRFMRRIAVPITGRDCGICVGNVADEAAARFDGTINRFKKGLPLCNRYVFEDIESEDCVASIVMRRHKTRIVLDRHPLYRQAAPSGGRDLTIVGIHSLDFGVAEPP